MSFSVDQDEESLETEVTFKR